MASVPATIPSFTTLRDDIDFVLAADQNTPNDEITALATWIGMMGTGKTQSYGTDIVAALKNNKAPICYKKDADEIYVSAGVVWISNSGQTNRMPRRNTSVTTVSASNIDTGSMAASTYYYIYAVADSSGTTFTVKFSTSASSPSGLTNFELIGWFYNESAGALNITSGFLGNVRANGRYPDNELSLYDATAFSTSATSYSDVAPNDIKFYAPSQRIEVEVNLKVRCASSNQQGMVILEIDGVEDTTTNKLVQVSTVATSDGNEVDVNLVFRGTVAAAQCNIQVRAKAMDVSYTFYVKSKYIKIRELEAK